MPSSSPCASIRSFTSVCGRLSQYSASRYAATPALCAATLPCMQKWNISFFRLRHTPTEAGGGNARRSAAACGRRTSQNRRTASVTGRVLPSGRTNPHAGASRPRISDRYCQNSTPFTPAPSCGSRSASTSSSPSRRWCMSVEPKLRWLSTL